jgi:RNA polymerase sigma factor (sigma-70 family)
MDAHTPKNAPLSVSTPPLVALIEMMLASQDRRVAQPRKVARQGLRSRCADGQSQLQGDIAEVPKTDSQQADPAHANDAHADDAQADHERANEERANEERANEERAEDEQAGVDLHAHGSHSPTYLQEVRALPKLRASTELRLFGIARSAGVSPAQAAAARRQVIRANLWMVPIIVRRYYHQGGSVFDDLVAEGNLGLYKAFDRFDPTRGFRFSTYAKWWVTDAVTAGMAANAYPLRMPRKVALALARQQHSDEPAAMQLSRLQLTDDEALEPSSVDPFEGGTQHEGHQPPAWPEQIVALRQTLQRLAQAVVGLPQRERMVIESRYGLNGSAERTLQDIGDELGVTAERVRTLQLSAMGKLKQHIEGKADRQCDEAAP